WRAGCKGHERVVGTACLAAQIEEVFGECSPVPSTNKIESFRTERHTRGAAQDCRERCSSRPRIDEGKPHIQPCIGISYPRNGKSGHVCITGRDADTREKAC